MNGHKISRAIAAATGLYLFVAGAVMGSITSTPIHAPATWICFALMVAGLMGIVGAIIDREEI